ncbi:MAG TPA: AraC family transcriptional regulator [Candidatus Acidoferrales bacterium]|jgi:AraC-like DNA-binding protein|nr:AraC family transcriptional regulator [Candidatus Acidoferrales bacterium]
MKRPAANPPGFFSAQVSSARRFYLNLQPPRGTRLAVVCGGVEHCAADYEIRRETFPFYSIEYVARGEGRLKLGTRTHALKPGVIFAYGPGIRQHITSNPHKPLVKYFVDFAGTQSVPWIRRSGLAPGKVSHVFPPNEIQPLFDELIRSGQRGTRHSPELCHQLLGCLGMKLLEARAPLKDADSPAYATYQTCRQFIADHSRRLRTLAQTAQECHLDTAYLCRLFRRYDHQSPYQFLTRLKMNDAAAQLQQPGALVKNIAADLGFTNPFHFSRVFKSVFGISPEAFRRLR